MPGNPTGDADVERAVVAEVIARDKGIERAALIDRVSARFERPRIESAIDALSESGVVVGHDAIEPSAALARLDEIGMIAI
jgi:hypothetical protein